MVWLTLQLLSICDSQVWSDLGAVCEICLIVTLSNTCVEQDKAEQDKAVMFVCLSVHMYTHNIY